MSNLWVKDEGGIMQPVGGGGGVTDHDELLNVTADQHHTRYTDAEATDANAAAIGLKVAKAGDVMTGALAMGAAPFDAYAGNQAVLSPGVGGKLGTQGSWEYSMTCNWDRGSGSNYISLGINGYNGAAGIHLNPNTGDIYFRQDAVYGATTVPTLRWTMQGGANILKTPYGQLSLGSGNQLLQNNNHAGSIYIQQENSAGTAKNVIRSSASTGATSEGYVQFPFLASLTTGSAATMHVTSSGYIYRSTSSLRYKTDVEDLAATFADRVLDLRPIFFRSTQEDQEHLTHHGLAAEEVAAIEPRWVNYMVDEPVNDEGLPDIGVTAATPGAIPDGVQYEKMIPALISVARRQRDTIEALTETLAEMGERLDALEQP